MKIHAIRTGSVRIKVSQVQGRGHGPRRRLNVFVDREWTEPLPIYAWVIEHPEGVIVVDTGETSRVSEPGYFPRWHPYFRLAVREEVAPEQTIGRQLRQRGIEPGDVLKVVMTHLHTDHAGGLHDFPNKEILVNEAEYRLAQGFGGRVAGYLPQRWPSWFRPQPINFEPTSFGPFESSARITEVGDVVLPTPGHTAAHVSVVVVEGERNCFLAGDTSYTQQLLVDQHVDGISPDEATARQTMQKILRYVQENATVYLPTHDPDSGKRLENRATLQPAG